MTATTAETEHRAEIPLGSKIEIEITRPKKKATDDRSGKRVVVEKVRVRWRGQRYRYLKRGNRFHYIDTEQLIWQLHYDRHGSVKKDKKGVEQGHWKLTIDENECEPRGKDGKPTRSAVVSHDLRDEVGKEIGFVAQRVLPIQIDRTIIVTIALVSIFALLMGLGLGSAFGPTTQIHWVTSRPTVLP